jgi:hypothetical protein
VPEAASHDQVSVAAQVHSSFSCSERVMVSKFRSVTMNFFVYLPVSVSVLLQFPEPVLTRRQVPL